MSYVEIRKLLQRDELQKMKQNQDGYGIRLRIDFNANPGLSVSGDIRKGKNPWSMCVK